MARAREFTSGVTPPPERTEPAWWFVFRGTRLLVRMEPAQASLPHLVKVEDLGLNPLCEHYLGGLMANPVSPWMPQTGLNRPPGWPSRDYEVSMGVWMKICSG